MTQRAATALARDRSLLDIDADLGAGLTPREQVQAHAHATVPLLDLGAGEWFPERLARGGARPFALLVVQGLLVRDMLLADSTASELLGPGDVIDPRPPADALVPVSVHWTVPDGACVALVDERLRGVVRNWPALGTALMSRMARQGARLSTHRAIAQLPRVDQRLLALFGHLAERWGRVSAAGVIVPMQLTHETLGRLVGARRPTVSLAMKELQRVGTIERRYDGSWIVAHGALAQLAAEATPRAAWQPADAHVTSADAAPAAPSPARISVADLRALQERVQRLREQHAPRMRRSAGILERCALTRRAVDARLRAAGQTSATPSRAGPGAAP